ncbi:MAG: hypothetical protein HC938_17960 [Nitrospira sp.]|nr:hypothetical protein [Nitrospira sp.]
MEGEINYGNVLADAFGNALGNAVVESALGGKFFGPEYGRMSEREKTVEIARLKDRGITFASANEKSLYLTYRELDRYRTEFLRDGENPAAWATESAQTLIRTLGNAATASSPARAPSRQQMSSRGDGVVASYAVYNPDSTSFGMMRTAAARTGAPDDWSIGGFVDGIGDIRSNNPMLQGAVFNLGAVYGVLSGIGADAKALLEVASDAFVVYMGKFTIAGQLLGMGDDADRVIRSIARLASRYANFSAMPRLIGWER